MPLEDKQKRNKRISDWQRQNKDRIILLLDKADGERLRQEAKAAGKSITQYIIDRVNQPGDIMEYVEDE
jgi:uncharacterized protein (DUF1778 family)